MSRAVSGVQEASRTDAHSDRTNNGILGYGFFIWKNTLVINILYSITKLEPHCSACCLYLIRVTGCCRISPLEFTLEAEQDPGDHLDLILHTYLPKDKLFIGSGSRLEAHETNV
jgi:hypothetical protein